jgi:LAO/AO transport system kinase
MVDMFLVLVAPAGGDELQGLKRGIMELADLVVVNKADGDLAAAAAATASDYASALHLLRPRSAEWFARVLTCSALEGTGVADVWAAVEEFRAAFAEALPRRRAEQARDWLWSEITESLTDALRADPAVADLTSGLEGDVAKGATTPTAAAQAILAAFLGTGRGPDRR